MEFEDGLAAWLVKQRWFAGKGRTVHDLAVVADTEIIPGDPGLRHLLVTVSHGATSDCYQLFIGQRARLPARLRHVRIGSQDGLASLRRAARQRPDPDAAGRDRGRPGRRRAAVLPLPRGRPVLGHRGARRPGQPGADRRAEQHQPGVRGVGHLQGVPPGRAGPEPGPGGRRGAGRARLDAHRRAVRLGRDPHRRRDHDPGHLVPVPARRHGRLDAGRDQRPRPVRPAPCRRTAGRAPGEYRPAVRRHARARPAATSRARPNGSAWRPPRCTRTWPRRSAPPSSSPTPCATWPSRCSGGSTWPSRPCPSWAIRRQGRQRLLQGGQADRAGPGPAGARRLPPGPGHADPDRLGGARLRGRAGQPAGPAPGPLLTAAGRGRHAPLVRLRGPAPAAQPSRAGPPGPGGQRLGAAQRRGVLRGLRRGRRPRPGSATPCCCAPCCWTRRSTRSSTKPETVRPGSASRWSQSPKCSRRTRVHTGQTRAEVSLAEIERLVAGQHHDPHSILGAHPGPDGSSIRALRPLATSVRWCSTTAAGCP